MAFSRFLIAPQLRQGFLPTTFVRPFSAKTLKTTRGLDSLSEKDLKGKNVLVGLDFCMRFKLLPA
jgi:hypothetical protein